MPYEGYYAKHYNEQRVQLLTATNHQHAMNSH